MVLLDFLESNKTKNAPSFLVCSRLFLPCTPQVYTMALTWRETFPPSPTFTEADIADQFGRVFIITGGSSGCGYEVAKAIYWLNGRVYIAGRSEKNAEDAIRTIESEPSSRRVTPRDRRGILVFLKLDLNDLGSVKTAAQEFISKESRLDVIWHNAGLGGVAHGSKTVQGFESHFGVNALGPFLLQKLLNPLCLATGKLILRWTTCSTTIPCPLH